MENNQTILSFISFKNDVLTRNIGSLADWGMVILTLFLVFVGVCQLILFFWQLKIIRKTVADTNLTAIAAKESADAAKSQAEIAEKTFSAANRPWVTVNIQLNGPLHYDENGLNIHLIFNLKNIGHSPAINAWVHFKAIAPAIGVDSIFDPRVVQQQICIEAKSQLNTFLGHVIFPGDTISQPINTIISHKELQRITQKVSILNIIIVGCIDYGFVFASGHHQTGFILELRRNDLPRVEAAAKGRSPSAIFLDDGDVPVEDVRLFKYSATGFTAD